MDPIELVGLSSDSASTGVHLFSSPASAIGNIQGPVWLALCEVATGGLVGAKAVARCAHFASC